MTSAFVSSLDKAPGTGNVLLHRANPHRPLAGGDQVAHVAGTVKASYGYAKQSAGGGFTGA